MEKVRYMIGDAAGRLQVEAHVLRYWEEELDLKVPRNELGHRYYTEENLKQFEEIKRLKEEGFQLKAIKMLIHNRPSISEEDVDPAGDMYLGNLSEEKSCGQAAGVEQESPAGQKDGENRADASGEDAALEQTAVAPIVEAQPAPLSKLEQFQLMMNEIVRGAIAENNQALGQEIGEQVGERVLKEMNYLMRDREEQEEERFRKLDETIRTHQRRLRRTKTARKKGKSLRSDRKKLHLAGKNAFSP